MYFFELITVAELALAENCSTDTECLDDNAACDPDTGTCCCLPGFFDSDGVCVYSKWRRITFDSVFFLILFFLYINVPRYNKKGYPKTWPELV